MASAARISSLFMTDLRSKFRNMRRLWVRQLYIMLRDVQIERVAFLRQLLAARRGNAFLEDGIEAFGVHLVPAATVVTAGRAFIAHIAGIAAKQAAAAASAGRGRDSSHNSQDQQPTHNDFSTGRV
jgi:hypothetical protein